MANDDHISPALVTVARKDYYAVADTINGIAQIGVAAADSVPIFAEMSVRPHSARFVISTRIRFTHRQIKTIRQFRERCLPGKTNRLRRKRLGLARWSIDCADRIRADLFLRRRSWRPHIRLARIC